MQHSDHINNHPICQCKNSIKLRILEHINMLFHDKPCLTSELVDAMAEIVKKDNPHIEIDDSFLKTYIMSIVSEMIENNLIGFTVITPEHQNSEFYFVRFDNEGLKKLLDQSSISLQSKNNSEVDNSFNDSREVSINSVKDSINTNNNISKEIETHREELIEKLVTLKAALEKLKKEDKTKELLSKIHKYNAIKDIGQELVGHIATNKGKTIKELYSELDISDDDQK